MRYEDASGAFQASGPIANDDADTLSAGQRGPATGNLITGEGTQYGSAGADSAAGGHITAIAGKGGEDTSFSGGKLSVAGEHGRLTVDADGNYSYLATGNVENVRDRFTYTLADNAGNSDTAALIVEIGKTPAVIKANAQQIVPGPDGVVTLPPGVELSDVHVVGRNLVVDLPDGTQLVIIDGAIFVPQLALDGVEVPATNVAALLVGQEIQPAAGELPPSSGGNFALPPPPLDPGIPLGDLIPPTELTYIPPEPQEVLDTLNEEPEAGPNPVVQMDDDAKPNGNPGGTGDDPDAVNVTGQLSGSGGDGELIFAPQLTGAPAGFTYVSGGAGIVLIQQGGVTVVTVTVNPDGSYSVVQNNPIDHAAGGTENNVAFTINYTVTDEDGDFASSTLTIDVDDDTPLLTEVVSQGDVALDETAAGSPAGFPISGNTALPVIDFNALFGADGAAAVNSTAFALVITGGGTTSIQTAIGDFAITLVQVDSDTIEGRYNGSNVAFTIQLEADQSITLTQNVPLEHLVDGPPGPDHNDTLDLAGLIGVSVTITDGDGDTASAQVGVGDSLVFFDDGPDAQADGQAPLDTVVLDETRPLGTDTPDGDPPSGDDSETINFADNFVAADFGADGAGTVAYQLLLSANGIGSGLYALEGGDTSDGDGDGYGQGAEITLSQSGNTITGSAGGVDYFTITINPATGEVTFVQLNPIWHPIPGDFDETATLNTASAADIRVQQTVTDSDGDFDSATVDIGRGVFSIEDDGPDEFEECPDDVITVNNPGSTFTGDLNLPDVGEDEPGAVTFGVADGDPVLDTGGNPITSQGTPLFYFINSEGVLEARAGGSTGEVIFTVTLNGDGTFTYEQLGIIGEGEEFSFNDLTSTTAGNVEFRGVGADDPTTLVDLLISGEAGGVDATVNTDSDSIGTANQSMDNGETVRIDLVEDLTTGAATPSGFGYSGHFSSSSFIGLIPQVQGSQDETVAFTVWALDSSVAQGTEPDRDPAGGFSDSTVTAITEVTVKDFLTGDSTTVAVAFTDGTTFVNVAYGISVRVNADGSVTFSGIQEGDSYGFSTGGGEFNAIAVQAEPAGTGGSTQDSFDLGVFSIGVDAVEEPFALAIPIALTDADGDPVVCDIDITFGPPVDTPDITVTVNEAGLPLIGSDAASDSEIQSGDLQGQVTGGTGPYTFALVGSGDGTFGTLVLNPDGTFTYTLDTPFDSQPDANDGTNPELGAESFTFEATDSLGATQTGTITVNIIDDVPDANDDSDTTEAATDTATGNVISGADTNEGTANADFPGADGFGAITNLVGFGGSSDSDPAGGFSVNGEFGTLQMDANGNYTYTRTGGPGGATDTFTYTYRDGDGDLATAELVITIDDNTPTAGSVSVGLDDDALANGNPGGTGDDPDAVNVSGNLPGGGGDPPLTFGVSLAGAPAGFTYESGGAGVVLVKQGGVTVLTVTVGTDGSYSVVQNNPIDHAAGGDENNQNFTVTYTVTDSDTDVANGTINISVDDDTPTVSANAAVQLDDDALAGGNPGGTGDVNPDTANTSGTLGHSFGADGAGSVAYLTTGAPAGFTYELSGSDLLIKQGTTTVITLTVDPTTGAYTVTQNNPIDHAAGGNENDVAFTINYRVTDGDSDTVDGSIVINVDDDTPTVSANAAVQLDDDALAGGNPGGTGDVNPDTANTSGTLGHSFGADGAGSVAYLTTGAPAGFTYELSGDSLLIKQGTTTVITLTLNTATGAYTVTQNNPIDHAAGGNENDVAFTIGYQVTDGDGDTADGSIVINVDDDTPTVSANAAVQLDDETLAGGIAGGTGDVNPDTANTSGTLGHSFGADGAGSVAYLTTGAPAGFTYEASGDNLLIKQGGVTVITLTLNTATGAYTVTQNAPILHPAGGDENDVAFTINYRVTDGDSDTVDGSIVINVDDDSPNAAIVETGQVVSVDESVGIQIDSNDTTNAGVIALFAGVANTGTDTDLPQYAQNASAVVAPTGSAYGADGAGTTLFSLNVSAAGVDSGLNTTAGQDILLFKEGNLIVGRVSGGPDDGKAAFAIAIDPVTGVISMVEYLSIQHPLPANPDDSVSIADGAILAVVTVTDADGDAATQSVGIGSAIQFQDSAPVMTAASDINIQNSGDVAHTGTFAFNLGADGAPTNNDVIKTVTFSAVVNSITVQTTTPLTQVSEDANTAVFSFSFTYATGGGNTATTNGTLTFNKLLGTYTVDLDNPITGISIVQTATGTDFTGYDLNTSNETGSQPDVAVTQLRGDPDDPQPSDLFIQFTSIAEPSSGTGSNNLFTEAYDLGSAPGTVPGAWSAGELFAQEAGWVSASGSENGVNGDTVGSGEVLDFNLFQGANPTGFVGGEPTASATTMFLKFDGITDDADNSGNGEDLIVILKLYDTVADTYTTKAVIIQNTDIQKGPGTGPGEFSSITLDNNDGLIIIEPNDYQEGNTNLVIVGAQIVASDEGVTGTAIDFNNTIGVGGASTGTEAFSTDNNDGPLKISSIGFITTNTTAQNAELTFNVTVQDGDGDTVTQTVVADVTSSPDSSTPLTLDSSVTTVSQTPLGTKSTALVSETLQPANDVQKLAFSSVGNTGITSAMVAASGIAMMSSTALTSFNQPSFDSLVQHGFQPLSTQMSGREGLDDGLASISFGSEQGYSAVDAVALSSTGLSFDDHSFGGSGLEPMSFGEAAPAYVPNYASGEPAVANIPAFAANVPSVSMASAEMLSAVNLDGNVQLGGAVEQVLADALGNHAPTIDGVLANLPGGIAELAAIANLASPDGAGVPAWDMMGHGAFGPAPDMVFKVEAVMIHQDAVQPA